MAKVRPRVFDNPALEILYHAQTVPKYAPQLQVLLAFHEKCGMDEFYGFEPIAQHTGIEWKRVRVLARRLARKGLLVYQAGLFNWDGDVAGAGYTITKMGRAVANIIEDSEHEKTT